MFSTIFIFSLFFFFVDDVKSHGMMLEPPNRSSMWRFNPNSPPNYNDNQNFCGGVEVQWDQYGGKCGVCGDPWDAPHPQDNENTGLYGQGLIARQYLSGTIIEVHVNLTSNHEGNFKYSLCVLTDSNRPESGEECFMALVLGDGSAQYNVFYEDEEVVNFVRLPVGVSCERCVLRWHYTAGNSWGQCEDGSSAEGCGPQETFRSCADIRIV